MKTSLHLTLAAAAGATFATAQETVCACSPTVYNFKLNFDGKCDESGFESPGVEGVICFFTEGDAENIDVDDIQFGGGARRDRRALKQLRQPLRQPARKRMLSAVDVSSHINHAKEQQKLQKLVLGKSRDLQGRQDLDTTPTVVTSTIFLESDTSAELNIINQDSTYFDTTLEDGAELQFTSISSKFDEDKPLSEQMDLVPGGVMMVMFGLNAANEVVQNTVAWGYDTGYCNGEPLAVGDSVGWVTYDGMSPPDERFCPGIHPTIKPTPSPVEPVMSLSTKSSKPPTGSKAEKPKPSVPDAKAEKMSMPTTSAKATKVFKGKSSKSTVDAKSSKGGDKGGSKGSEDTTVDAKAGKPKESLPHVTIKESAQAKADKPPGMSMPPKGHESSSTSKDDTVDSKAGKEGGSDDSASAATKTSSDEAHSGKEKGESSPDMSMPSSKTDKPKPEKPKPDMSMHSSGKAGKSSGGGDAKSGKEGGEGSGKSGKAASKVAKTKGEVDAKSEKMSMPHSAKPEKGHESTSSADGASSGSAKAPKKPADPINTSPGYVEVVDGAPEQPTGKSRKLREEVVYEFGRPREGRF